MRRRWSAVLVPLALAGPLAGQTVVVDNADPGFTPLAGDWSSGAFGSPWGDDYRWALTSGGGARVEWRPDLPQAGTYEVAVHHVSGANRASDAPFEVHHAGGVTPVAVDQQQHDSTWVPLGAFPFAAGTTGSVQLASAAGPTVVIADAVRFRPVDNVQIIAGDDARIVVGGALYPAPGDFARRLDRVDPVLRADPGGLFDASVAVLTSGVTVRFRTDSPTVRANFNHLSHVVTRGTGFVVYRDGVFDRHVAELETVDIGSPAPGAAVTYEIVCPSYDEVTLADLELDPGATLLPAPTDPRPVYFAFGDSITHGSEIDADTKGDSTTSYPWQLAATRGWRLFNLGVGGSRVTPDFGEMLAGPRADVITVLWGLNDMARDNDLPQFVARYGQLLDNLRAGQPHTPICCITMIANGAPGPGVNGYTLDDYRDALTALVAQRAAAGDCHLHLLRGEQLTTLADLSDGAHFSVAGAARFAAALAPLVPAPWGDFDDDGDRDADDWWQLVACLAGPDAPAPCAGHDRDCDGDVDLREVAALQVLLAAP